MWRVLEGSCGSDDELDQVATSQFDRRESLDVCTIAEDGHPVGSLEYFIDVMGHEKDAVPGISEVPESAQKLSPVAAGERGGGFVEHNAS